MTQQQALIDLQERISHQDAALQELTKVVLAQEDQIKRLKSALISMKQELQEVALSSPAQAGNEPPPHY
ncbi:MAG: SlyX family protein [gamma proteobacterium symbiont of Bathyaustriella thionipta]|nr:SlyX family protein [gamma proteobacterium symbiont of Bathyaustriella thionipta]